MFKFALYSLKKNRAHFINKIIYFICVFIHVFCFWEGKFIWHTSYEICMIFIKMPILNGKKMN